jgi:PAS domain S-box-containing protein
VLDEIGTVKGVLAIVVDTTAKIMSERWRDGERDRLRQMFEQAPGFMAMLSGPDHVFDMTNAAYLQLVGHRDVIGLPVRQALPDVEGQGFFELLDQVYQSGEAFVGSALPARLQRRPDSPTEERCVDLVYQPIRNPKGEVVGIFVEGADVTDRMVAQNALRQSEAQFRAFAESMPNHVWTAGPDGLLTWFNPQVYTFSGAEVGTFDGMAWAAIVHPDDLELAARRWEEAIVSGVFYETEFRLRRHDGVYRWHIARAVPIRAMDGEVVQWIGTNTDIHDQKAAAQRLADSERRLKLSQNAAGISALELDIASGTVIGSDGFWDLWGLTPRESVHISVLEEIVLAEDRAIRSNSTTRGNGTATPEVEYRIRRPDTGEVRWVSRNVDFVRDEAGRPAKMFGVMQDITARKSYEARQKMLTHELEHRIKNILAMVSAIASQTLRKTDIETGRTVFNERLRALAKAHDLLNETRWTDASMLEVINRTVSVFPVQQISIAGPPIALTPKIALSLALAVNELGTNAMKYGALSVPAGLVDITWQINAEAGGTLIWTWRETGGPLITNPSRRGFGSFLVERVLATDFEGDVRIEYAESGLSCTLTAPSPSEPVKF